MRPGVHVAPGLGRLDDKLAAAARRYRRRMDSEMGSGRKRRQQTNLEGHNRRSDDAGEGE